MDMPDLYQVKWKRKGGRKWTYGIVSRFGDEEEKAWKTHRALWVSNAVTPEGAWVRYDHDVIVEIPLSWENGKEDEYHKYIEEQRKKAEAKSEKTTGLVGKLFSVGVADGFASYVVVKENKKTVKVEWRGFCLDRYTDTVMGWGGTFEKERIARLIHSQEALKSMFTKHGV